MIDGHIISKRVISRKELDLLWIKYILSDVDGSYLNEYIAQPFISQIHRNKQLKESYQNKPETFKSALVQSAGKDIDKLLDERSSDCKQERDKLGVADDRPKSILKHAKEDPDLFDMYVTLYMEGSKLEHSDISSTQIYRESILPEYDNNHIFKFMLNVHDEAEWKKIFKYTVMCVFWSYDAIRNRICTTERHLFEDVAGHKGAYDEKKLMEIIKKIAIIQMKLGRE